MELFNQIKSKLDESDMTQQELSKSVNRHNGYLWQSIKNETIKVKTLKKVCEVLNIKTIEL